MTGREKLRSLGLDSLPLLPTTAVGSFPKPPDLKKARTQHDRGEIAPEALRAKEREATAFWIEQQERVGLDVLVDGEQYRGDMVEYFAREMDGFAISGLVRSYGNRYYKKPILTGPVRWRGPITVDWWKYAQSLTKRPVKGMLTGPYTMMDWSFNEHYKDRRAAALALAKEVRREVEALVAAGCKIIQVDEPAVSVRPEELPLTIEAMKIVTDGLVAYFVTHICYGRFEAIYPRMLDIPVDNFDLELSNSELDLLPLMKAKPFTKDISFGAVDVHTHAVEDLATVARRVRAALEVLPAEKVWVDPDCGLKTREVEEAIGKIEVVADATRAVRAELVGAKT